MTHYLRFVTVVAVLVALAAGVSVQAQVGESFDGPVVSITDGDTISVLRDGEQVRVRVEGIDTPESDQAFGAQASAFTSSLLRNKRVAVRVRDVDRYGRLVSRIRVDGIDLSVALVTEGLAWHYTQYSDDPELARAEAQARAAEIGLWSQSSPVPPWEFRQRPRTRQPPGTSDSTVLQHYDDNGNGRITCAEARRHGIAPVRRGHPAYRYMNDRDRDGIVCEQE